MTDRERVSVSSAGFERRRMDRKPLEELLALGDLVALVLGGKLSSRSRWRALPRAWRASMGHVRWPDHAAFPTLLVLGSFLVDLLCHVGDGDPGARDMREAWRMELRRCAQAVHPGYEGVRAPFILAEVVLHALARLSPRDDGRSWRAGTFALVMVGTRLPAGGGAATIDAGNPPVLSATPRPEAIASGCEGSALQATDFAS